MMMDSRIGQPGRVEGSADLAPVRTFEVTGPRCPYCQHLHMPDDPVFFDEMMTELECEECMKTFEMRVFVQTSWTCSPASKASAETERLTRADQPDPGGRDNG